MESTGLTNKENLQSKNPTSKYVTDHDHRELYKKSQTGLETLLSNNEGFVVGRLNNSLLRYKTDAHLITISPTGGGKTSGSIIPNLLDHPGSAFVIDIRGETVAKTANAKRIMGQRVVVLDPYNLTNGEWGYDSYNIFDRVTGYMDFVDVDDRIERIVTALMFDSKGRTSNEPIWDNATKNLLVGLISYVLKYLPKERHNLAEVLDILNYSSGKLEWFTAEIVTLAENDTNAENDKILKSFIKILTDGKSKTKVTDNAFIQAQTFLAWIGNKSFQNILAYSTFSFENLQNSKMTVYLVVPEEYIKSCASWIRLLIESAVFSVNDIFKSRNTNTANLPQSDRILFLLDELPAFGQLDIISSGMATLRGRGINLWLFLQNISQLDDIYGENKSKTIIGNAAAIQLFESNELHELEYFTKIIGDEFYDVQSVTIGESETKGKSVAKGTSHTISDSESTTHTQGTSDSISEATTFNWSKAHSESYNRGTSRSSNTTKGTAYNKSSNTGWNRGESKTINRNSPQGLQRTFSNSSGTSGGKQSGNSYNKSKSNGFSYNEGVGKSKTSTHGGGTTNTKTHSVNESFAYGETQGTSDTTSETMTNNQSFSTNRSITVKQERMKIETVRTLREKLTKRNQLLLVRGFHPFFTPKMSYFVSFLDDDKFMFPELMTMINTKTLEQIANDTNYKIRLKLSNKVIKEVNDLKKFNEEIKDFLSNEKEYSYNKNSELISQIQDLFLERTEQIIKILSKSKDACIEQSKRFSYLAGIIVVFLKHLSKSSGNKSLDDKSLQLIELMNACVKSENITLNLNSDIEKYKNLPIKDIDNGRDKAISDDGYYLSTDDKSWIIKMYEPVVQKLIKMIEKDVSSIFLQIEKQENTRKTLLESTREVQIHYHSLLDEAILNEINERKEFMI